LAEKVTYLKSVWGHRCCERILVILFWND